MAAKQVTESARIVVRSTDGNRIQVEGKGSATESMHTAFCCLPYERRARFLDRLHKTHSEMTRKEAAAQLEPAA